MKYVLFPVLLAMIILSCNEQDNKNGVSGKKEKDETGFVFTDTTACIFAQVAYSAYPQQKLDKYLPGWKVVWDPVPVSGNYAFVASNGDTYALAFRGSLLSFTEDAFNNWIYNDLNVAVQDKWPYSDKEKAKISHGAYIGWQNIEKMKDKTSGKGLWSFLSETVKDENPLILTGHSLGGNLAIVYGSYLRWKFEEAKHSKNNINIITFAAPAPGNKAFADDFNDKFRSSMRIENYNDIVPKFPCSNRIATLSELYSPGPSAAAVTIGYKNVTTQLSKVFTIISTSVQLLEFGTDFSGYSQTNGAGTIITIPLSGKNTGNLASSWFAEAGYQHSMAQYAKYFGMPVIAQ